MNKKILFLYFSFILLIFSIGVNGQEYKRIDNNIIETGSKTQNYAVSGGKLYIHKDYSGLIKFGKDGGEINFGRKYIYSFGNSRLVKEGETHEFKSGTVLIKDGKIVSIKSADIKRLEIPVSHSVGIKGVGIMSSSKILISGEDINFNSKDSEFRSIKRIAISQDGENYREIIPISNREVIIKIEEGDPTVPIIKTGESFVSVNDGEKSIGLIKGDFYFNSYLHSPKDVIELTPIFPEHKIEIGYEEHGPDFTISPSEGEAYAKMRLENGIRGSVMKTTFIKHMEQVNLENEVFFRDQMNDITSGIAFNGDLHIIAKDDNWITLNFDDDKFDYVNADRILDNSYVNLRIKSSEDDFFDGPVRVIFSKDEPITGRGLSTLETEVGTIFQKDGQDWSWEIKDGNPVPEIFQNRMLFASSNDLSPDKLTSLKRFINPETGEVLYRKPSKENLIRKILAEPLVLKNKGKGKIVSEKIKPHELTTIDHSNFFDKEEFIQALKTGNPDNKKYDRLVLTSFGRPQRLMRGALPRTFTSIITTEDLESLSDTEIKSIQNNFESTATCTFASCFLFTDDFDVDDPQNSFGSELTEVLGMPVLGSDKRWGFEIWDDRFSNVHISNFMVVRPLDGGGVSIETIEED